MNSVGLFGSKVNERASLLFVTNIQTSPPTPLLPMNSTSSGEGGDGLDYLAQYIRQMPLDFLVGEAQDTNTPLCQKVRALGITGGLLGVQVNATVHLDSQLTFDTEKVKNKLPVRMLSPELKARQLPITQR